jgi:hypothetical protein
MGPNDPRGEDVSPKPASDIDWQRLWFATRQSAWSSLAIIPSEPGVDVVQIAESLVATGRLHGERAVSLLDATGVHLEGVHQVTDALSTMTARGEWVIVPVGPIAENPSAVPIVQATSAALLVVRLGESLLASARTAIETVGRERFLGSIVLDGRNAPGTPIHLALPALSALAALAGLLTRSIT